MGYTRNRLAGLLANPQRTQALRRVDVILKVDWLKSLTQTRAYVGNLYYERAIWLKRAHIFQMVSDKSRTKELI